MMVALFNISTLEKSVQVEVKNTVQSLRDSFQARSPVLTGRYKQSWRFRMDSGTSGTIFNVQPYGVMIESGYPSPPFTEGKKGKGLIDIDGTLWSRKAPGGTINPVLGFIPKSRTFGDGFANRIANSIVRGLNAV